MAREAGGGVGKVASFETDGATRRDGALAATAIPAAAAAAAAAAHRGERDDVATLYGEQTPVQRTWHVRTSPRHATNSV